MPESHSSQIPQPVVVNTPVVGQDVCAGEGSAVVVGQVETVLVELDFDQLLECCRPHAEVA